MASSWIAVGFHEYAEIIFALDFLRPGDLFVDVGANLGVYSTVVANRGVRVIAFEPNPQVAAVLRDNAKANHPERIEVREVAAGDRDGVVDFSGPTDSQGRLFLSGPTALSVHMRRLDTVFGSDKITMIKIDAEGYDGHVLRGATEIIKRNRPVLLTEVFAGSSENRRWLEERGYRVYTYEPRKRQLDELPASFDSQGTFIAIPDERFGAVASLVRTSERPELHGPKVIWNSRQKHPGLTHTSG